MSGFALNANVKLVAPNNTTQVLRQIQQQFRGLNVPVNVVVKPNALNNIQKQLNQFNGSINATTAATKKATSEIERFGQQSANSIRRFFAFTVATVAVYKLTGAISKGVDEIVDFNREMNRLEQVTGLSQSSLKSVEQEVTRLSTSLGTSSSKLIQIASTLAQAGLSAKDTKIALEALAKTTVSATFGNIKDTSEAAIATMQQFGKEATDLEGILSSINKVSAAFASESEDITKAVRLSGSSFAAAGDDFHKFQALFVSVRQTTRGSAESIATGLRTISARLQRPQTQSFLKSLNIDLLDSKGQFIGVYNSVEKLSAALKDLPRTDPRFAKIAEELGGYRQLDKIIPLIDKFDIAQKAYNISLTGGNSLTQDAAVYQKSFAAQLTKVNEEFQSLLRKFADDSGIKAIVFVMLEAAKAAIALAKAITPLVPLLAVVGASKLFGVGKAGPGPISQYVKGLKSPAGFGFNDGGPVPGTGNGDTVNALLTPGEFVLKKSAVKHIGLGRLNKLNQQRFAKGGPVGNASTNPYVPDDEALRKAVQQLESLGLSLDKLGLHIGKNLKLVDNIDIKGTNAPAGSTAAGVFRRGGVGGSNIELNKNAFSNEKEFFSTLAHEVGHAIDNAVSQQRTGKNSGFDSLTPGSVFNKSGSQFANRLVASRPNLTADEKRYYGSTEEGFARNFETIATNKVFGKGASRYSHLGTSHESEISSTINAYGFGKGPVYNPTKKPAPQSIPVPPSFFPPNLYPPQGPVYGPPRPPKNIIPYGPPRPPGSPPRGPIPPNRPSGSGGGFGGRLGDVASNPLYAGGLILLLTQFTQEMGNGNKKLQDFIQTIVGLTSKVILLSTAISAGNSSFGAKTVGPFQTIGGAQAQAARNARSSLPLAREFDGGGVRLSPEVIKENIKRRNAQVRNAGTTAAGRFRRTQIGAIAGGAIASFAGDQISASGATDIQAGDVTSGRLKSTLGGTLSGAGTGAAAGSVFGPIGIAAGAAAGALYGFTTGLIKANKDIADFNIAKSLDDFGKKLSRFSSGGLGAASFQGDFVKTLNGLGDSFKNGDADQKQNIKAGISANAPAIQDMLLAIAKSTKSFDDFDVQTRYVIDTFAELSSTPFSHLKDQIENTIKAQKNAAEATIRSTKVLDDNIAKLQAYNSVIRALNTTALSLDQFEERIDRITALSNGTAPEGKPIDFSTIAKQVGEGKFENLDIFKNLTKNIGANFGGKADSTIGDANQIAQVLKDLPEQLLATRAQSPLGKDGNFTEQLLSKFKGIPDFAKDAIGSAIEELKGEGGDDRKVLDAIKNDLYGTVEQLSKSLKTPIDQLEQYGSLIANQNAQITRAYSNYNSIQLQINESQVKRLDKEAELEDIKNEFTRNGRTVPLANLQARESQKAIAIGGSDNVDVLAGNLKSAQDAIAKFDDEIRKNAFNQEKTSQLTEGRSKEVLAAERAAKGLNFLANESKSLSNIQKELGEEQRKAAYSKDLLSTIAFGSNEEKKRASETVAFTALAKEQGIGAVPQNRRRDVQQALEAAGDTDAIEKILKQAGINAGVKPDVANQLAEGRTPQIDKLLGDLNVVGGQQLAALQALESNLVGSGDAIGKAITDANTTFLADLKKIFENQAKAREDTEKQNTGRQLEEVNSKLRDVSGLRAAAGLPIGTKVDKNIAANVSGLLSDASKKRDLTLEQDRTIDQRGRRLAGLERVRRTQLANNGAGDAGEFVINQAADVAKQQIITEFADKLAKLGDDIKKIDIGDVLPSRAEDLAKTMDILKRGLEALGGGTEAGLIKQRDELLKKAGGGFVPGAGNSDSVPALLTPGEFVITKQAARAIGAANLNRLNGKTQRFAKGGRVKTDVPQLGASEEIGSSVSNFEYSKFLNKGLREKAVELARARIEDGKYGNVSQLPRPNLSSFSTSPQQLLKPKRNQFVGKSAPAATSVTAPVAAPAAAPAAAANNVGLPTNPHAATNSGISTNSLLQLGKDLKQFSTDTKGLAEAMRAFPHQLEITMNGKVEVILNGIEAFKTMEGKFKGMVIEEIKTSLDNYHKNNHPDDGQRKV